MAKAEQIAESVVKRAEQMERDAFALRVLARILVGKPADETKAKIMLADAQERVR